MAARAIRDTCIAAASAGGADGFAYAAAASTVAAFHYYSAAVHASDAAYFAAASHGTVAAHDEAHARMADMIRARIPNPEVLP